MHGSQIATTHFFILDSGKEVRDEVFERFEIIEPRQAIVRWKIIVGIKRDVSTSVRALERPCGRGLVDTADPVDSGVL